MSADRSPSTPTIGAQEAAHPASADPAPDPALTPVGSLSERMGIEILEASPQRTVGRMPVAGNTQPYGILHGGASAVLAETLGSIAAFLQAGPGRISLGLELSCTHHRSVREGYVTGTATALSLGRTVAAYDIRIVDDQERPICTARLTCLLRDA